MNNNKYTLENISELRALKKEEIKKSKENIRELSRILFAPPESRSKMDILINNFNTGMAAYDGIMTGLKVLKRIKSTFRRKNSDIK